MSSPTPPACNVYLGPPAPTAPARRSRRSLAAALVAGLVLGAGGAGTAWALSGGDGSADSGAAGDARRSCEALQGFHGSDLRADGAKRDIAFNRLGGAAVLSAAAAAGDREFKPLAEAVQRVQNRVARFADVSEPEAQKELKTARSVCAGL
ncbi:hypothetical protein SHL15_7413 [Streptomyces hygroscopicus subsp. limoneus]|nr:hypothetical protein SHL15_7413 [Streptomyces hygroscopicus subsp. limoneus]